MKKLKLKLGSANDMLTREQMKKITGGYDPDPCFFFDCHNGEDGGPCNTNGTVSCTCNQYGPGNPSNTLWLCE